MKNKSTLTLMEQMIMLLVFALSAALCLQVYVLSSKMSHNAEDRGNAATTVQNIAESIKLCGGDSAYYPELLGGYGDSRCWQIEYDENWQKDSDAPTAYRVIVTSEPVSLSTLGQASVSAQTESGDELFRVIVAWQVEEYE